MINILLAIAPIFLLIVLGHVLRRGGIPSAEFWNQNDRLVYWVLFPALLFYKMATMELSGDLLRSFATVIYAGLASAILFALLSGKLLQLKRPLWTSVLQGSARHNTFIALAIAEEVFGTRGLQLATLITALLIPLTNISIVSLMILMLRGVGGSSVLRMILLDLARNPLLIAVGFGFVVNLSGIQHIPILFDVCIVLGGAALPIVLLCVGANIRVRAMSASAIPILLSMTGKMLVFPFTIGLIAHFTGLDPEATMIAMIFGAVPTAAGAYTLAREMGGDAPAMAAIVTVQTALAFVTVPLTLLVAGNILGVTV
ncbi:MAG: AEC family transporter [Granulosicoccus sp.]|nr:AEC family transporter [Granulosicoccus sp.]